MTVKKPQLRMSRKTLDFGAGFYTTSDYAQAEKWAVNITKRRVSGQAAVSVYEIDDKSIDELNVLSFEKPDKEWLDFVVRNRRGIYKGDEYDIITGPVANDNTMPVLNMYISGFLDEEFAVKRLLPQKLKDQTAFKTQRAVDLLRFKEAVICKR
ncbi:MAG: DUF3990 domain-containing protein [Ruminococcus sp.]|nr:DUF3990 domain-containing protein [Ruminococcus sp.]